MRILSFRLLLILSTTFLLFSCQKVNDVFHPGGGKPNEDTKYNTFKGPQVAMGSGMARSFIVLNHKSVPLQIGVEMTHEVLSGLPKTNFSVAIPLHNKAKEATPFDHL